MTLKALVAQYLYEFTNKKTNIYRGCSPLPPKLVCIGDKSKLTLKELAMAVTQSNPEWTQKK